MMFEQQILEREFFSMQDRGEAKKKKERNFYKAKCYIENRGLKGEKSIKKNTFECFKP